MHGGTCSNNRWKGYKQALYTSFIVFWHAKFSAWRFPEQHRILPLVLDKITMNFILFFKKNSIWIVCSITVCFVRSGSWLHFVLLIAVILLFDVVVWFFYNISHGCLAMSVIKYSHWLRLIKWMNLYYFMLFLLSVKLQCTYLPYMSIINWSKQYERTKEKSANATIEWPSCRWEAIV